MYKKSRRPFYNNQTFLKSAIYIFESYYKILLHDVISWRMKHACHLPGNYSKANNLSGLKHNQHE